MEIYLFFVGFLVTCLVIASIFLINSEEKDKYSDIDKSNEVDYDGMGNYGRFLKKINFSSSFYKAFNEKIKAMTDDAIIAETLPTARSFPLSIAPFKGMNRSYKTNKGCKERKCAIILF